jgi:hypothetical protein
MASRDADRPYGLTINRYVDPVFRGAPELGSFVNALNKVAALILEWFAGLTRRADKRSVAVMAP